MGRQSHNPQQEPNTSILATSFLLLGAGASADAKVPMAREFIGSIRRYIESLTPESNAAPLLAAHAEVLRHLERLNRPLTLEPYYELLDDALDAHAETKKGNPPPQVTAVPASRAFERLHYDTKRVIQRECDVTDASRADYLVPLLKRLAELQGFPVVSFNYDNIVELAAAAAGVTIAETVLGETAWHKGEPQAHIELIKVHGSITWHRDHDHHLRRSQRYATSIIRSFGEMRSPILESALIYPSRRKMPLYAPFMHNAQRLQALLSGEGDGPQRKACVAVGYSFPDPHVRAWLFEAMSRRSDLRLYLVDPYPEVAIRNLTINLPTIPWPDRLFILPTFFKPAIQQGFEQFLASAVPYGPQVASVLGDPPHYKPTIPVSRGVSGLAASPDGTRLYMSEAGSDRVLYSDLREVDPTPPRLLANRLRDPRGLAVTAEGDLLVVQNALFRRFFKARGMGTVIRINRHGTRRSLNGPHLSDIRPLAGLLRTGIRSGDLWEIFRSILRWPTDVAITATNAVYVTEARGLTELKPGQLPDRRLEGDLMFNLVSLDLAENNCLLGIDAGVAGATGWGRLKCFEIRDAEVTSRFSPGVEGYPLLQAVCFVPTLRQVVVSQTRVWPHGRLIVLDYPDLDHPRYLEGFDAPTWLAYLPDRDVIAVGVRDGVHLMAAEGLKEAV
jgi:hypothetical protein